MRISDWSSDVCSSDLFVAAMFLAEVRQNTPKRLVAVVIVLELLQRRQQCVPPAFGNADGEQNEKRIQAGLFNHHAMLGQMLGDQRGRYPGLGECSRNIEPRSDDGRLDRVQHIRSEERRVGNECVSPCRSRWAPSY